MMFRPLTLKSCSNTTFIDDEIWTKEGKELVIKHGYLWFAWHPVKPYWIIDIEWVFANEFVVLLLSGLKRKVVVLTSIWRPSFKAGLHATSYCTFWAYKRTTKTYVLSGVYTLRVFPSAFYLSFNPDSWVVWNLFSESFWEDFFYYGGIPIGRSTTKMVCICLLLQFRRFLMPSLFSTICHRVYYFVFFYKFLIRDIFLLRSL